MRAVLVPGVPALLPAYAGLEDPVADLRAACAAAVAWAAEDGPVTVLGTEQGRRVAEALVAVGGFETVASATSSTTVGPRIATSSTTVGPRAAASSTTGAVVEEGALAPVSKPPLVAAGGFETVASATSSTTVGPRTATSSTTVGPRAATSSTAGTVVEEGALAPVSTPPLMVVANGSAKRREGSPGHVDERAVAFDADLGARLRAGTLADIDHELARELWADTTALDELARLLPEHARATVDYEDDPYGVQYWVVRWEW